VSSIYIIKQDNRRHESIRSEVLEVATTDSRGDPHHVCGVVFCSVWHLVPHILGQLLVCPSECHINISDRGNSHVMYSDNSNT